MTTGTARGLFALAVLAYLAVFVWFSPLPLQDYPNHLARAFVMSDLLFRHGAEFGQSFRFHLLLTPYLSGDLLLTPLVYLIGVKATAVTWAILTFLSLPAAAYVYLRAMRASTEVMLLMLFISLYLSTDTFFVMGFFEFKLSIALTLVVLAVVELLRQQWSGVRFGMYAALLVLTYLTHLAAIAFIAAVLGVSALWRVILGKSRIDREIYLFIPIIGVLAWHVVEAFTYRQPGDLVAQATSWGTVGKKIFNVSWDVVRYHRTRDFIVVGTLLAFLLLYLNSRRLWGREGIATPTVLEPLAYAVLFIGLYIVLPYEQTEAAYVDVRAMALAPFFLVLGLLNLPPSTAPWAARLKAPAICLAAVLACVNLCYLALYFHEQSDWLPQYRSIVARIPANSTVLPIFTEKKTGNVLMHLHAASYAVIDRHALIPYLFSGDNGSPMKYFRYVHRPMAPSELWYRSRWDSTVDWPQVSRDYQYLLITKPFDADRIRIKTRTVAENDTAALLAVEPSVPLSLSKRPISGILATLGTTGSRRLL